MSRFQPSFETNRPVSLDLGRIISRSPRLHLCEVNKWSEEPNIMLEQCLGSMVDCTLQNDGSNFLSIEPEALSLKLTPSILKLDLSYCVTVQDTDVVKILKQVLQLIS